MSGSGDLMVFEKHLYFSTFFCFSNSVFIKQLWLHLHICKYSYQHITYLTARAVRNAKTSPNTDKTKNCARPYLTRSGHPSGSRKRRDLKLFVLATVLHDTWRAIRAAGQAIQSWSIYCSGSPLSIFGRFISFFFVFWFLGNFFLLVSHFHLQHMRSSLIHRNYILIF